MWKELNCLIHAAQLPVPMGVNAVPHFMNQVPFHSTFPILVITKIFDIYAPKCTTQY